MIHRHDRTRTFKFYAASLLALLALTLYPTRARAGLRINGQTPGATPFISLLNLTSEDPGDQLDSVTFKVKSKPGSVVRPVKARYGAAYLQRRGYLDPATGAVTVPVFGLYADYANTVKLRTVFADGRVQKDTVTVATVPYVDAAHAAPEILLPRTRDATLSYSYYLLKSYAAADSPLIFDTDGELRWAGTVGAQSMSALYLRKGIYLAAGTTIFRMELDGVVSVLGDYASLGISGFHHNLDRGRDGILAEVDKPNQIESIIWEIDPETGARLHLWDMSLTVGAAMAAGGDDPARFVKFAPTDWFHNNSVTYRAVDNTLVVSSRESFVLALDYDSQRIRWILGNRSKTWAQFPSLLRYALALGPNTHAPIGQHALSVVGDDLLLFDNGQPSAWQEYPGKGRAYSAGRKYRLDTEARTATETWTHAADKAIFSPYCSSVYEDAPGNFLLDYATAGPLTHTELVGLNDAGEKVFDYRYPAVGICGVGFNAVPLHLEKLDFDR